MTCAGDLYQVWRRRGRSQGAGYGRPATARYSATEPSSREEVSVFAAALQSINLMDLRLHAQLPKFH